MKDRLIKAVKEEDWPRASSLLYEHWSAICPKVHGITPDKPWESRTDEQKINDKLLHPLCAMYTLDKDDSDPDPSLNKLAEIGGFDKSGRRPGQICGKVFKSGEPTYTCKECATDGTCVMCRDCFNQSAHRRHKYKMHTSGGGGFCDCGDIEAWSQDYACRLHTLEPQDGDEQLNLSTSIPKELQDRIRNVSLIVLKYAVHLLCWEESHRLPDFLKYTDPVDATYHTVLFNDETHTYDSVIRALELAIHCSENEAMLLATIVDREGRSIVKVGSYDICEQVKTQIQRRTGRERNSRTQKTGPLEVKVIANYIVFHQVFAVRLLNWLTSQTRIFPKLSTILGDVLLNDCIEGCKMGKTSENEADQGELASELSCNPTHQTSVVKMMLFDRKLWKSARSGFHQLLMGTVLMDTKQKQEFGRIFVRCYKELFRDFIDDDHEHSVSIVSMSVQVFTVPSVARYLIVTENAVDKCLQGLVEFCAQYISNSPSIESLRRYDFSQNTYPAVLKRALCIMTDIGYLLTVVPKPEDWDSKLRNNFLNGIRRLLEFLRNIQGMDEIKRQVIEHQLMESEWETAFNIFIRMEDTLSSFISWAKSDRFVHLEAIRLCLKEMEQYTSHMPEFSDRIIVEVNGCSASCIEFDVSKNVLSLHQPIWRFFAGLFTALPEILANYVVDETANTPRITELASGFDEFMSPVNLKGYRAILLEMPLRVLVLYSQTHAQLWRRNGFSLVNQIHNYNSPLCRLEMYDRDVLMVQIVAALSDPTTFLIRLYDRFGLAKWAQLGFEDLPLPTSTAAIPAVPSATPEELSKITVIIAEEMLHLLIVVLGERYMPGVGKNISSMDVLKREIIHLLSHGEKPFSYLERNIPINSNMNKVLIEEAARQVGELHRPTAAAGVFRLKENCRDQYNCFFYHYTKQACSLAEQQQKKDRANADRSIIACPPPTPPDFEPFFEPINRIMESPLFVKLIRVIFERFIKRSRFASEGLLHRALFLLGMGLNEQTRCLNNMTNFKLIELGEQEGFSSLLSKLESSKIEAHGDLVWYITNKYKDVKARIYGDNERRSSMEKPSETKSKVDAAQKTAIAAKKRQIALAQMQKLQKSFKKQHKELIEEKGHEIESSSINIDEDTEVGYLPDNGGFPVACGPMKSTIRTETRRQVTCILCQEDQILSYTETPGRAVVLCCYIQESTLLTQRGAECCLNDNSGIFMPADLKQGIHVSTCGHTLHFDCFKAFTESLSQSRLRPRQQMLGPRAIDPESEYLCPLCKRLSNCALPLLPVVSLLSTPITPVSTGSIETFSGVRSVFPETFEKWVNRVTDVVIQPSRSTPTKKTHSRKRSHSERSLAELNKKESVPTLDSSLSSSVSAIDVEDRNTVPANLVLSDNEEELISDANPYLAQFQDMRPPDIPIEIPVERHGDSRLIEFLHRNLLERFRTILPNKCPKDNVPTSFSIWPMIKSFCKSLHEIHTVEGVPRHFIETICVYKATAFSLRSISYILREENKPLFGAFNTRQADCISGLSRLSAVIGFNCRTIVLRLLLARLLTPLLSPMSSKDKNVKALDSLHPIPIPSTSASTSSKLQFTNHNSAAEMLYNQLRIETNILEVDMLTLSIELAMCIGWSWVEGEQLFNAGRNTSESHRVPDGSIDENYSIRLCLVAYLFQVMVASEPESLFEDIEMVSQNEMNTPSSPVTDRLSQLYNAVYGSRISNSRLEGLLEIFRKATIDFLRPLAILYNAITLVPPPESLKDPSFDEFEPLCRYMGMPNHIEEILEPCVDRLFSTWSSHLRKAREKQLKLVRQPIMINKLIDLPTDFSDLINMAANFRCPVLRVEESSASMPSLCLCCGVLLCSQSYCCQKSYNGENVGACTFHMTKCSASCGIFLRIRECQIIFLTSKRRGCFKPAPYIDEFGETDPGFRRGNPLHLNMELYKKLQRLWLHQEIAEEVINQYELNHRNITYDWHHF